MAHEMDRYLAGDPSGLLVRRVRSTLKGFGILPREKEWKLCWAWADKVQTSYNRFNELLKVRKKRWPRPNEIAAQYLTVLLASVREEDCLKLPERAAEQIPERVAAHVAELSGFVVSEGLYSRRMIAGMAADNAKRLAAANPIALTEHVPDAEVLDG